MYCVGCGATLQAGEVFCGSCGRQNAAGAPRVTPQVSRLSKNRRLLAILWLALSAFRLIPGIAMLVISGNAHILGLDNPDVPEFVPGIVQIIGYCFVAFAAAGFAAGWGLLTSQPWSRMLAIVLGAISLIDIPFGTSMGIYTLWVLLPAESEAEFHQLSNAAV